LHHASRDFSFLFTVCLFLHGILLVIGIVVQAIFLGLVGDISKDDSYVFKVAKTP
jgi:hypothetical protein